MRIMVYLIQEISLYPTLKEGMCSGLIVMIMLRTILLNYFSIIQKSMTQIILFTSIKGEIRMIINFY